MRDQGVFVAPALCLLGAIAATWPLLLHMSSAIPLGTEQEATVPLLNLWILWWTSDRVSHGFSSYWNAPIFYPNQGVFTYSEPQPLTGLMVSPLWAFGLPPALAYNCALLLILTLNGWFAYRVLRALRLPPFAAALGGLFIVTLPFIAKVLGVLPMLPVFGALWTFEGLVRFSQTRRLGHALWACAGYVAQFLTSQQLALLGAPFLGTAGLLTLWSIRHDRRAVNHLLITAVLTIVLLVGFTLPIIRLHRALDFERPFALVLALSAEPFDFITRPSTALLSIPPHESSDRDSGGLFPGLLVVILAGVGFVAGFRRNEHRLWCLLFGATVMGSFVLACGLHVAVGSWHPFWTLHSVVPGFGQLRSPFRFAVFTQLGLSLLAAIALAHLMEWRPGRQGTYLALTIGLLACVENLAAPIPLIHIPTTPRTEWTAWLKSQPKATIVAHIPFPAGQHVSHYEIEGWRLFAQMHHQKPIINGYSGFFPPGYLRFQSDVARDFPRYDLLCMMAGNLQVNTVVIDQSWLAGHREQLQHFSRFLQLEYQDNAVTIFRLRPPKEECPLPISQGTANPGTS